MTNQERAGIILTTGVLIIVWIAAIAIVSWIVTYGIASVVGR